MLRKTDILRIILKKSTFISETINGLERMEQSRLVGMENNYFINLNRKWTTPLTPYSLISFKQGNKVVIRFFLFSTKVKFKHKTLISSTQNLHNKKLNRIIFISLLMVRIRILK